jgi:2-polyprenyl-3-methyl-5-hydroxy-6-metoxy-1,4-benzoquinol methylase
MFEFHKDKKRYFEIQTLNTEAYVIPFIESVYPIQAGIHVLEVGCAEGGVIKAFIKKGCFGVGVELDKSRAETAKDFLKEYITNSSLEIIDKNIYDPTFESEFSNKFDLIVLKDVIEHIHDQEKVLLQFRKFLKPNGKIFFGFPPFNMPFGGHQQICKSPFLSRLPYFHILPSFLYRIILKAFNEDVESLMEIKETGISINRFKSIVFRTNYTIKAEKHFLINPIYKYKFGIEAKEQYHWITKIPFVRDFLTTCVFYVIEKQD